MKLNKFKPLLLIASMALPSILFAETYEGKSQAEINKQGKDFTNNLNKGAPTGDSSNSVGGMFGDSENKYQNIANATYNTNVIPTSLGKKNIQECTSMTQEEVNALINSGDAEKKMRGIECDAVRTNEQTNDLMETRRIDPKKDSLITTFNENQQKAAQTDSKGNVSITCNTSSTGGNSKLEESCIIVATPTLKTCFNKLTVACIEKYSNQAVTNKASHCRDEIGIDPSKTEGGASFDIANQAVHMSGNSGNRAFFVKNKDEAIAKYGNFYRTWIEGWKSGKRTYFNGREIWKGKGGSGAVENWNSMIVEGWNTLSWDGGASLSIKGPFFQDRTPCEVVCNDVWDMVCSEEIITDNTE